MIVVSDTSPITALITVGHADLLEQLFVEVIIPHEVELELKRTHPSLPAWIKVRSVLDHATVTSLGKTLDLGEAEAIQLAKEIRADRILIDERKARKVAESEGLSVIGLLGVVILARERRLIPSARHLLQRLYSEAGIYLAANLVERALSRVGE